MKAGDIREITIRRELELEDGSGGHVPGVSIRIWVAAEEPDDELLALTLQAPRDNPGDLLGIILHDQIQDWIEIVAGLRG